MVNLFQDKTGTEITYICKKRIMQKLDYVKNLEDLVTFLKVSEITEIFDEGFKKASQSYTYTSLRPLLFTIKSNFDTIRLNSKYSSILEHFGADAMFSEQNLTSISINLANATASSVFGNSTLLRFYNFNRTILESYELASDVLLSQELEEDYDDNLENGILIFQVVISHESLSTEKYIKILSAIQDLVQTINKIVEEDESVEVVLLDSGSDTNIGIKTGIETAKSVFLIFKEIWTFIFSHKHYVQNQKNKTLLESLSVREEIQKKVDAKIITEDEAKAYVHIIKTRTDDLIGLKVIPKQIIDDSNTVENKKLLMAYEGTKLLSE